MSVANVVAVYRATNNIVQPVLYNANGYAIDPTLTYTLDDDGLYTITLQSTEAVISYRFTDLHTKSITEIGFLDLSHVTNTLNTVVTGTGSILRKISGEDWVASSATTIRQIIRDNGKTIEEVIVPNLVTSTCTLLESPFTKVKGTIDTSNWDVSNVTKIDCGFYECDAEEFDISGWKFNSETLVEIEQLFYYCNNVRTIHLTKDAYGWRRAKISKIDGMFSQCPKLTQVFGITLLDVSECTYISDVFRSCDVYTDFTFLPYWDTHNIEEFVGVVYKCKSHIDILDYSNWNSTKCKTMSYLAGFENDIGTIYVNGLFNIDNTDTLFNLFSYSKVDSIIGLENFDFTNVFYIQEFVSGLTTNQSEYKKMEQWRDLSSVQCMCYLWAYSNVETVDVSNWITANITCLDSQFEECPYLTHVKHHPIPYTVCEADYVYAWNPNLVEVKGFNNFYLIGNESYGESWMCPVYTSCEKLEYIDFSNVKIGYHPDPNYDGPIYNPEVTLVEGGMPLLKTINLSGLKVNPDYGWFELCYYHNYKEDFPSLTNVILNDSHSVAINYVIDSLPDRTGLDPGYLTIYNTEDIENVNLASAEAVNWVIRKSDDETETKTMAIMFKNDMAHLFHKDKKLI